MSAGGEDLQLFQATVPLQEPEWREPNAFQYSPFFPLTLPMLEWDHST